MRFGVEIFGRISGDFNYHEAIQFCIDFNLDCSKIKKIEDFTIYSNRIWR